MRIEGEGEQEGRASRVTVPMYDRGRHAGASFSWACSDASEEMVMSFEDLGQRDSEGQIDLCSLDSGSPVIEPTRVHVRPNDSILDDLLT